jgi:hypothetical protein
MQSRSFLRLLTPLALAALLVACGDDGAGGSGDTDESTAKKRDAGIKRRDGGASKTAKDEEPSDDSEEDEDETPVVKDAGVKKVDAGKTTCTTNNDCISDEMSGIGCCDKPTKVCFFTEEEVCPAPKTPTST